MMFIPGALMSILDDLAPIAACLRPRTGCLRPMEIGLILMLVGAEGTG